VDGAQGRRSIARVIENNFGNWWLDAGNDFNSGQVLLGNRNQASSMSFCFDPVSMRVDALPSPARQQPSLITTQGGAPRRHCAEDIENNTQSQIINQFMASLLLEFVRRMFRNELSWMSAYIDMNAGSLRTQDITPEAVGRILNVEPRQLLRQSEQTKEKIKVRV
jgi:hypothetical protein